MPYIYIYPYVKKVKYTDTTINGINPPIVLKMEADHLSILSKFMAFKNLAGSTAGLIPPYLDWLETMLGTSKTYTPKWWFDNDESHLYNPWNITINPSIYDHHESLQPTWLCSQRDVRTLVEGSSKVNQLPCWRDVDPLCSSRCSSICSTARTLCQIYSVLNFQFVFNFSLSQETVKYKI